MSLFVVVAGRATPTNLRLGPVMTPARAAARLRAGDVALARIDVRESLDGVEPGLWALDLLGRRGVTVLNERALAAAHDKLATAEALTRAARVVHDGWLVLEVDGAVDFDETYSLDGEIFATVRSALLGGRRRTWQPVACA